MPATDEQEKRVYDKESGTEGPSILQGEKGRGAPKTGSPAGDVLVRGSRTNGFDTQGLLRSAFSGRTNETGELAIEFGTDDPGAQTPGTHVVSLVAQRDHRNFRGHASYQVALL